MRTVKDTLSLGDYVFLLNTLCSLDVSFCSPSYHDSDILRSGDKRGGYFSPTVRTLQTLLSQPLLRQPQLRRKQLQMKIVKVRELWALLLRL